MNDNDTRSDTAEQHSQRVTVPISKSLVSALQSAARADGRSMSGYIRKAVTDKLQRDGIQFSEA
jgi:predicted HicB family RNase H-like nuclease